ncbi:MAG: hypothetical protein QM765_46645 [Myxococcales bacterium]
MLRLPVCWATCWYAGSGSTLLNPPFVPDRNPRHAPSLSYVPAESDVSRFVPPTEMTFGELLGQSTPPDCPLSPAAVTNVTPRCPLGVVNVLSY